MADAESDSINLYRFFSFPLVFLQVINPLLLLLIDLTVAKPAESYPLYSSFFRPSKRIGEASREPTNATIPHIYKSMNLKK